MTRLLLFQDRTVEARTMLTEIYSWFVEGLDTVDLQKARALLEDAAVEEATVPTSDAKHPTPEPCISGSRVTKGNLSRNGRWLSATRGYAKITEFSPRLSLEVLMTRTTGLSLAALLLAGSTALAFRDAETEAAVRRQFVNVNTSCPADGPNAQIVPDRITAAFGDTITWHMNGPASSSISITPKAGTDWPFTATQHDATPTSDAATDGLRRSIPARGGRPTRTFNVGDTARYDVTVTCPDGRQTVIDPEVVIGGGDDADGP